MRQSIFRWFDAAPVVEKSNKNLDDVVRSDIDPMLTRDAADFAWNDKPTFFFDVFFTKLLHDRQVEPQFHHDAGYVGTCLEHIEDKSVPLLPSDKPHVGARFAYERGDLRLVVDHFYLGSSLAAFLGLFIPNP